MLSPLTTPHVPVAARDEFLAFICHELRNPLNGAMGMANMLLELDFLRHNTMPTLTDAADMREHIRTILDCCDLMCSLVNDVLDFSKIEQVWLRGRAVGLHTRAVYLRKLTVN